MRNLIKKIPLLVNIYVFAKGVVLAFNAAFLNRKEFLAQDECTYFSDGFATTHHVAFMAENKFLSAFEDSFDNIPEENQPVLRGIAWRAHICTWAANQAAKLDGDFVECGVWYGVLSKTICNYLNFEELNKTYYLVDSWGEMPGSHAGYKDDIFSTVSKRFEKFGNVKLVRGLVPEILPEISCQKVAFLSIDMNGSVAERAALDYFYSKMVPGGIIYFDDYGWDYPMLRDTVDDFFRNKPEEILHFPSGNSIVVKI